MRFRIGLPAMARCTFSSASAAAKMLSSEAPTGTSMVARSLPSTCTAKVTLSATSSAGSASGQGSSATRSA